MVVDERAIVSLGSVENDAAGRMGGMFCSLDGQAIQGGEGPWRLRARFKVAYQLFMH